MFFIYKPKPAKRPKRSFNLKIGCVVHHLVMWTLTTWNHCPFHEADYKRITPLLACCPHLSSLLPLKLKQLLIMCTDRILITLYGCPHEYIIQRCRGPKCEHAFFSGGKRCTTRARVEEKLCKVVTLCEKCKEHCSSRIRGTGWDIIETTYQQEPGHGFPSVHVVKHKVIDIHSPTPAPSGGWGDDEHGYYHNYTHPEPRQPVVNPEIREIIRIVADCDEKMRKKWQLYTPELQAGKWIGARGWQSEVQLHAWCTYTRRVFLHWTKV